MFVLLLYSMLMWLNNRIMSAGGVQADREILWKNGLFALVVVLAGLGILLINQRLAHRMKAEKSM